MAGFTFEDLYPKQIVVGVDEVGRGAWAGPVVAGAVIINRSKDCSLIRDSKQLSKKNISSLADIIKGDHVWAIGLASVEEIEQLNISGATSLAMQRAIEALACPVGKVLVDGLVKLDSRFDRHNIIKGDDLSVSIAAASIVAKDYRDRLMIELAQSFPFYGWESNVGYGTAVHIEGLERYGITEHHRLGYKPIRKYL